MREPAMTFSVTLQSLLAAVVLATIGGAVQAEPPAKRAADVDKVIAQQTAQLKADTEAFAKSKTYPYFSFYQSPGMRGRPDTELREVLVGSLPNEKPEAYNLRVVKFANRKGVDTIDVDPRMPLREWTFTDSAYSSSAIPWKYRTANHKSKAHLAGFRGIGYVIDKGEFKGAYRMPKLLLRFPDGRLRTVDAALVSEADRDFMAQQYKIAMDELKAHRLLEKPYVVPEKFQKEFANPKKPGEKNGHMITESEFFFFTTGTEHPEPGNRDHWCQWINPMGDRKAGRKLRTETGEWNDAMWRVYEYAGFSMPGMEGPEPRKKFWWKVGGPTIDGKNTKGGGGGNHIGNGAFGIGAHEWGHCVDRYLNGVIHGGGETWADTLRDTAFGNGGGPQLGAPHNHVFPAMNDYGFTYFYSATGEDPSLGYLWYARLPVFRGKPQESSSSSLHLAAEMFKREKLTEYASKKMVSKPVEELGDLYGEFAARSATFDIQREGEMAARGQVPVRQGLERVDAKSNLWRIPVDFAPHAQGYNTVRLTPDPGAKSVTVDFTGMHDPAIFSDWRVCIIAVGADGVRRYSDLWNKGPMTLKVKPSDRSLWLSVAATPTALKETPAGGNSPRKSAWQLPEGHGKGKSLSDRQTLLKRMPTYPWMVTLTAATAGTPASMTEDFGAGSKITAAIAEPKHKYSYGLDAADRSTLKPHANGGGLVADTATVAATAYVGPNAVVLGKAQVLDNARIEGFAIVQDNAIVKENAKLYGNAIAKGKTVVGGNARFHVPVSNPSKSELDVMSVNPLPPRVGNAKRNPQGVWAAYAMMDSDAVYLQDYYRIKRVESHRNRPIYPMMNGYVFGNPQAVRYDNGTGTPAAGLQFDGVTQYAELHPAALDLPEATIVARLKVEPKAAGTIFDVGTDAKNRMVLSLAANRTLRLVATLDGKKCIDLTGNEKMIPSEVVQIRAEADGKTVAFWMNNVKLGQATSSLRFTDLFGPDVVRRNTIAASRDGSHKLKCLFDSLTVYSKVYNDVDKDGVIAFEKLPPPALEAPPIVKDNILALLEKRMDPTRSAPIRESAMNTINFYKTEGFGKVRARSGGMWNVPENFFVENLTGRRWMQLMRRDPDWVTWTDEIMPASKNDPKVVREKKEREYGGVIREKAGSGRKRDECRMLNGLAMALWRTHWDTDYMGYLDRNYIPAKVSAVMGGVGGENLHSVTVYNNLAKDPTSWIKSEDITVPMPSLRVRRPRKDGKGHENVVVNPWSVEGIVSGDYNKLTPYQKQWYLHTFGPIKR
ncbi:MAG: hypothetical protein HN919_18420 [Verrucomicrobia bacterium]|nr:hypothetical protein [Verrucomicrobiota bacterium]